MSDDFVTFDYCNYGPTLTNKYLLKGTVDETKLRAPIPPEKDLLLIAPLYYREIGLPQWRKEKGVINNVDRPIFLYYDPITMDLVPSHHSTIAPSVFKAMQKENNVFEEDNDIVMVYCIDTLLFKETIEKIDGHDENAKAFNKALRAKKKKLKHYEEYEGVRASGELEHIQYAFLKKRSLDLSKYVAPNITAAPKDSTRIRLRGGKGQLFLEFNDGSKVSHIVVADASNPIIKSGGALTTITRKDIGVALARDLFKIMLGNDWRYSELFYKNELAAYFSPITSLLNDHLHCCVISNLLYNEGGTAVKGGSHFRFTYGVKFIRELTMYQWYHFVIRENVNPFKAASLSVKDLITIIFQGLYALEYAWNVIGFTHNDLSSLKNIVYCEPESNLSYLYQRGENDFYVVKEGLSYFVKLIPTNKSRWSASPSSSYHSSDARDFVKSLLPLLDPTKKNLTLDPNFKELLIFCHKIGVSTKEISAIQKEARYHVDDDHYVKWRINEITPWKCLNESTLFNHLKLRGTKKALAIVKTIKYILVDGGLPNREFLKPLTYSFSTLEGDLMTILKETNRQLSREINAHYAQWEGFSLRTKPHPKFFKKVVGVGTKKVDITNPADNTDIPIISYTEDDNVQPKGASRSLFYPLISRHHRGFIVKRFIPNVHNRRQIGLLENAVDITRDQLNKCTSVGDIVTFTPNVHKIVTFFATSVKENPTKQEELEYDTVSETVHISLMSYITKDGVWNTKGNEFHNILQSIFFQTFHAQETLWVKRRMVHRDLNLANVMLQVTSIPSLQKKGKQWLYKRHQTDKGGEESRKVGHYFLYSPRQLEELGSGHNLIVKLLDFGDSAISLTRFNDAANYERKKDAHLFFSQLLITVPARIWRHYEIENKEGYTLFIDLCSKVISFDTLPKKNLVNLLLTSEVKQNGEYEKVHLYTQSMLSADQWLVIGAIYDKEDNTVRLDKDGGLDRLVLFNNNDINNKLTTVQQLISFDQTKNVALYEMHVIGLTNYPYFKGHEGLTETLLLDHEYFDTIMQDLSFLYKHDCILLAEVMTKEEIRAQTLVQLPEPKEVSPVPELPFIGEEEEEVQKENDEFWMEKPITPFGLGYVSGEEESQMSFEEEEGEEEINKLPVTPITIDNEDDDNTNGGEVDIFPSLGDDDDELTETISSPREGGEDFKDHFFRDNIRSIQMFKKLILDYYGYRLYLKKFVSNGESCTYNGPGESVIKKEFIDVGRESIVTLDKGLVTQREKPFTHWTDRLIQLYWGFNAIDHYLLTGIELMSPYLVIQYKGEFTSPEPLHRDMDDVIEFRYSFKLVYIVAWDEEDKVFTLVPYDKDNQMPVDQNVFLVYKKESDVVTPKFEELLTHNLAIANTLKYESFDKTLVDSYNDSKLTGLNNSGNDCFKNAVMQTFRYLLFTLVNNYGYQVFIPTQMNTIFKGMSKITDLWGYNVTYKPLDELVLTTTSNKDFEESLRGGQCDADEFIKALWLLIFNENTCNKPSLANNASFIVYLDHLRDPITKRLREKHTTINKYIEANRIEMSLLDIPDVFYMIHQGGKTDALKKDDDEKGVSVTFDKIVNLNGFTRELFALIVHKGETSKRGHYVAYLKFGEEKWTEFDDNVSTEQVVKPPLKEDKKNRLTPYIGFYRRV